MSDETDFIDAEVTTDDADLVTPVFDTAPQDDEATEKDEEDNK